MESVNCPKCNIEHWDSQFTETEYCVACSCEECNAPLIEDFDGLCGACDNKLTLEIRQMELDGICLKCNRRKVTTEIREKDGCFTPICQLCKDNPEQWIQDMLEE